MLTTGKTCAIIQSERTKKGNEKMTKLREELVDRMIRIYGFENPIVIQFCKLCESDQFEDWELKVVVESHECFPVMD
jgi:hypothetical protein